MLLLRSSSLGLPGFAAMVALSAAACSGSTSPSTLLSQPQAALLADGITFDAEGETSDATSTGGTVVYTDAPPIGNVSPAPQCTPTRSGPTTDTDVDGVPDSVLFTLNGCILSYGSGETDTLSGTIVFEDPTPTTFDHNVRRIYSNTVRVRYRSSAHSSETWTGTRTMTRDTTTLHNSETGFTTVWVFPNNTGTATHTRSWTSTFTADAAGSIVADQTLPSGIWNITGTSTWSAGGSSNNYTVTITTSNLHYNASCTATPRFDSGTLTANVSLGSQTGTVTVTVSGCGVTHITNA